MALARSEVARWWSLRSLGAPSRIVAGLSIEEFHPAAAATAAPRRSGLDAHTSDSSPRWVCMYAGEMFTATEVVRSWASRGREAAAAGTALSFQIPASHPTRCSRLDPHRHPASPAVARGSLFGARDVELHIGSAGAGPRAASAFAAAPSSSKAATTVAGTRAARRSAFATAITDAVWGDGGARGGGGVGHSGGGERQERRRQERRHEEPEARHCVDSKRRVQPGHPLRRQAITSTG
jgi:hypothetical protein